MSDLPQTMRKVVATKYSRDFRDATEIQTVAMPVPGPGEVLVRTLYGGVNASDVNASVGGYTAGIAPPVDMGLEALGEVVALGEGVQYLRVGQHVLAMGIGTGYCEYFTFKANRLVPVKSPRPEYLALIVSGLTAAFGLYPCGDMKAGETVLVTAAAGGTGQFAVQLAKLEGCHVIGTCGDESKAQLLRDLGVDRVVNYREEDLATVLKNEYRNKLDLVYESVGRSMFDAALDNLAIRGRLVVIGAISEYLDKPETINAPRVGMKLLMKSASIRSMLLFHWLDHMPLHMTRLVELVDSDQLKVSLDQTPFVGVEAVADAVDYLHSGKSVGKLLVSF